MNMTSFIFFTLVGLVGLWVASDYIPAVANIFSSLFNSLKRDDKTKDNVTVKEDKTVISDETLFLEVAAGYAKMRHQLKEMGNDVGVKQLDQLFQYLNQGLVKKA